MGQVAPTLDDWLTTEDVAKQFDVPVATVLHMCREGRLQSVKKGWARLIHKSWVPEEWPPPK